VAFPGTRTLRLPSGAAALATMSEQLLLDMPLPLALRLRRHSLIHYHGCASCQSNRQN
jgi:hypothetical protein